MRIHDMKKAALGLLALALWALPAQAVVQSTSMGNANQTASPTDQRIWITTAFTATRTLTLPQAGATCIGQTCPPFQLEVIDQSGVNGAFSLVIAPASGDTINGSTSSLTITSAGQRIQLIPVSGTNWIATITPNGLGTATNDNACTGCVGEFISAELTSLTTGGVVLANATTLGITGITIGAGDWDCRARANLNTAATTTVSAFSAWTSSVSGGSYTLGAADSGAQVTLSLSPANALSQSAYTLKMGLEPVRYSVAAATSVFLNINAGFGTAAASGYGFLGCRRMR